MLVDAKRCAPDALADLVLIAGDKQQSNEVRCTAMEAILEPPRIAPGKYNAEYVRRRAVILGRPPELAALRTLLDDPAAWCIVHAATRKFDVPPQSVSPRTVGLRVLGDFPVESLRQALEALRAGGDRDASHVLEAYDWNARHAPSLEAARLDALVADASPEGFESLLHLAVAGASPDVLQHIDDALIWMRVLAGLSRDHDQRDCVATLGKAISDGGLGKAMMDSFERLPVTDKEAVLEIFMFAVRLDSIAWLQNVAASDPDDRVRSAANTALEVARRRAQAAGSAHGP